MIRFRVLMLTVLVMTCAHWLQASPQSTDPRLIINNGHDSLAPSTCVDPLTCVGLDFSFMANGSGGGVFHFTNDSGQDWTFLEIEAPSPNPSYVITCGGTAFANCVILPQPGDFTIIDFSGGGGIHNGDSFTIDLGSSGWPVHGQFRAIANPVPEPGTLALSVVSLAPLLVRRFNLGARKRSAEEASGDDKPLS
jgi:hypothetical protein